MSYVCYNERNERQAIWETHTLKDMKEWIKKDVIKKFNVLENQYSWPEYQLQEIENKL